MTDNSAVILETVKQRLGIAMMPKEFAAIVPGIECVLSERAIPVPCWLVTHGELSTSRRTRVVFDLLAAELSPVRRAIRAPQLAPLVGLTVHPGRQQGAWRASVNPKA